MVGVWRWHQQLYLLPLFVSVVVFDAQKNHNVVVATETPKSIVGSGQWRNHRRGKDLHLDLSDKTNDLTSVFRGVRGGDSNGKAASSSSSFLSNPKVSEFVFHRLPPAIGMAVGMYAIVQLTGRTGLSLLALALQAGMYGEVCSVIFPRNDDKDDSGEDESFLSFGRLKWWWFVTALLTVDAEPILAMMEHAGEKLAENVDPNDELSFWAGMGGWMVAAASLECRHALDWIVYVMAMLGMVVAPVLKMAHQSHDAAKLAVFHKMSASHLALLYLMTQTSFWLRTMSEYGVLWLIFPSLLVIINDTMAYVIGMALGRRRMAPRLSPQKSWEGFVGAALCTIAGAIPVMHLALAISAHTATNMAAQQHSWRHALVMATVVSVVAPLGDFFASAVKRAHGAKDFGTLLGGHGGLLDRLDSQIVVAPFVYLYMRHHLGTAQTIQPTIVD